MRKHIFLVLMAVVLTWVGKGYAAMEVFVSIPPQKWLVEAVGREQVEASILVRAGRDPHTFEPSPRQVAALARAKIWFTMGMEFEQQLVRRVREAAPELVIVDMSQRVAKMPMTESDAHHEEDEHHDGDQHHDDEHHHELEGLDPHVWLSPKNLQLMSETVAGTMAAADRANAESYVRNQVATQQLLAELDQQLARQLGPLKGSSFFVFHPTFGYFARDYGLVQVPVEVGGKSPGPRQIAGLIGRAKEAGVKVIFVQPEFDTKSAGAVAAAIDGEVVPLDALAEDVPGNLRIMATKIEAALRK